MTVWQIFRDFSAWTSAHGIPHIGGAQNVCLRIFWTIIFTVSVGMFTWQMVLLIQKYLQYDVTVQTELMFQERSFPAVTICNLNPYIVQQAMDTTNVNMQPMADILNQYERAMNKTLGSTDQDFVGLNDSIAIQSKARDLLMYTVAGMTPAAAAPLFYAKNDFVINCAYNTKPCDINNDFKQLIDPIYGACYQFNNQDTGGKYNSTRAGPLYGLRVLLKSNQSQYINLTESAGVRVAIHNQGEPPFPDAFGYNAAAGFTTSFGIQFIETHRLPMPYGNCTSGRPSGIEYYYQSSTQTPYSTEACFRSCLQSQVNAKCSCSDPRFNKSSTATYCTSLSQYDCVSQFTGSTPGTGNSAQANVQSCACQQPCSESTYGVTVSTALWPSEVYIPPDCTDTSNQWGGNTSLCQAWYGENTMLVEVYYERMNYQLLSEQAAYQLVNLISDMGGQLGLWMGFSVITMIEFIALFILLIIYCCSKHQKQTTDQVHPFTEEEQKREMNSFDAHNNAPPPPYSENPHHEESAIGGEHPHPPGTPANHGNPADQVRNRPASVRSLAK